MIGVDNDGRNQYRICEVIGQCPPGHLIARQGEKLTRLISLGVEPYKMYQFQGVRDDRKLTLRHGKSERAWTMEQVSQSPFTDVSPNRSSVPDSSWTALTHGRCSLSRLKRSASSHDGLSR